MVQSPNRPEDDEYTYELRPEEPPSDAVVTSVAALTDRSPFEMDPLAETIDPDAVNDLLDPSGGSAPPVRLRFTYCGCQVVATPEKIRISQLDR